MNLTDEQIIKALECCKMPVGSGACNYCALKNVRDSLRKEDIKSCTTIMMENALEFINRQKAYIERLQKSIENQIAILKKHNIVDLTHIFDNVEKLEPIPNKDVRGE